MSIFFTSVLAVLLMLALFFAPVRTAPALGLVSEAGTRETQARQRGEASAPTSFGSFQCLRRLPSSSAVTEGDSS